MQERSVELDALVREVHATFETYVKLNKRIAPEILISVQTIEDPGQLADTMVVAGVAAMVYPTMPFNAPRAVDPWPNIRTTLGYGNWLGLPEVSVPAGLGADGIPALNISFVALIGTRRACSPSACFSAAVSAMSPACVAVPCALT